VTFSSHRRAPIVATDDSFQPSRVVHLVESTCLVSSSFHNRTSVVWRFLLPNCYEKTIQYDDERCDLRNGSNNKSMTDTSMNTQGHSPAEHIIRSRPHTFNDAPRGVDDSRQDMARSQNIFRRVPFVCLGRVGGWKGHSLGSSRMIDRPENARLDGWRGASDLVKRKSYPRLVCVCVCVVCVAVSLVEPKK
jgi:hypothetical protein